MLLNVNLFNVLGLFLHFCVMTSSVSQSFNPESAKVTHIFNITDRAFIRL